MKDERRELAGVEKAESEDLLFLELRRLENILKKSKWRLLPDAADDECVEGETEGDVMSSQSEVDVWRTDDSFTSFLR